MLAIRSLLAQRHFGLLVCVAALLLKVLVPSGYMIAGEQGRISVTLCSGGESHARESKAPVDALQTMPEHRTPAEHGKVEMPCAFTGLSTAALGKIDPVQLAAAPAFVMAVGLSRIMLLALSASPYLRPPLRAPPAVS